MRIASWRKFFSASKIAPITNASRKPRRTRLGVELLEDRITPVTAVLVNDNWHLLTDNGAAGVLDAGDEVRNDNDAANPSTITAIIGDTAFGTVTTGDAIGAIPGSATIQTAITAVDAGGTVTVLDGSYTESVNLNKAVTLKSVTGNFATSAAEITGAGLNFSISADGVTIDGLDFVNWSAEPLGGVITTVAGIDDVVISDNRFDTIGPAAAVNTDVGAQTDLDNWQITGNTVTGSTGSSGFFLESLRNSTISNNTISSVAHHGIFVDDATNVDVTDNTISNVTQSGIRLAGNLGSTDDVQVLRNSITNANTAAGANDGAFRLSTLAAFTLTNVTIANNTVSGGRNGMSVAAGTTLASTVSLANNSIVVATGFGVANGVIATLNASGNWWGTNTPAGVEALTSGSVDFTPWLDAGTDASASAGFQGDFSSLHVDDAGKQAGATGRITEGIAAVADGALVGAARILHIHTGTYADTVNVNKAVILSPGSSPGIVNITGSLTYSDSAASTAFEITGTNAATPDYDQIIVTGGATLGGANLSLSGAYVPVDGDSFTILQTTTGVSGTFNGLPQGATFYFNGQPMEIDYTANGNKDVVLSYDTTPVIDAGGTSDAINVSYSAGNIVVTIGGVAVFTAPVSDITSLTINGNGGDDTLTVDVTAGSPIPTGGLFFVGGVGGNDKLAVKGNLTQNAIYTPDAVLTGKGTVAVDGNIINFTGLEPVDLFGMLSATLMMPLTGANDTLTITNGFNLTAAPGAIGTIPALVVTGTTGDSAFGLGDGVAIETVTFLGNTTVVIDTTLIDGDDLITITSANNAHTNTNLTITTGAGADDLIVDGEVSVTGTFTATTPTVNLNNDITAATITGSAATVNVNNTSAQIQDAISVAGSGATVTIAVGTYAQNVVINKALTLDGGGATRADVVINPSAAGHAISVTSSNVTIQDLTVTGTEAAGNDGINVNGYNNLTIQNVAANSNFDDGIDLSTITGLATLDNIAANSNGDDGLVGASLNIAGTVTIQTSTFNDNTGDGVSLTTVGGVVLSGVTATGNDPGVFVSGAASFSDTAGNFSDNDHHGIQLIDIAGDVTLVRTSADDNDADNDGAGDGVNATLSANATAIGGNLLVQGARLRDSGGLTDHQERGLFIQSITGATTFQNSVGVVQSVSVTGNESGGVRIDDGGTTAVFTSGDYSDNTGHGIELNRAAATFSAAVSLTNVTAEDNTLDGVHAINLNDTTTITGGSYDGNSDDGLDLDGNGAATGLTFIAGTGNTASDNGDDGLVATDFLDDASITSWTFSDNTDDGIELANVNDVTIATVTADGNGGEGLDANLTGTSTIAGSSFDENARGILLAAGTLAIETTTINDNVGAASGAGINLTGGALTLNLGTAVTGNETTAGVGGGINITAGTLNVNNITISDNTSANTGGGLNASAGTTTIVNSTISGNSAAVNGGGGVLVIGAAVVSLTNSTVSGNTAGNGIEVDGGTLNLTHATIAFNDDAGVRRTGGTVNAINSLFASNFTLDYDGAVVSTGYNLFDNPTGFTGDIATDLTDRRARLAPLADYDGDAFTHALLPGSAALNAILVDGAAIGFDQRGVARPFVAPLFKDIGAFESRGFTVTRVSQAPDDETVSETPTGDTKYRALITKSFRGVDGTTPLTFEANVKAEDSGLTDLTGGVLAFVTPDGTLASATVVPVAPNTLAPSPIVISSGTFTVTTIDLVNSGADLNRAQSRVTANAIASTMATSYFLFATSDTNSATYTQGGPNNTDWILFNQKVTSLFYNIPGGDTNPARPQNAQSGSVTMFRSGNGVVSATFTVTLLDQEARRVVVTGETVSLLPRNTISNVTGNAVPIVITSANHGLVTGRRVEISGVLGNTNANGVFTITVLDTNRFRLNGAVGNGAYIASSIATFSDGAITAMSGAGATPILVTAPQHGLTTGQRVTISGVLGNTNANGTFTVTRVNANQFRLNGTIGNGAYAGGGILEKGFITSINEPAGTNLNGGTARTLTVSGVATFSNVRIHRSNFSAPYVLKAIYANPAPDSGKVTGLTSTFRVLPFQFTIAGGNFAGAFQTVYELTLAESTRGLVRLLNIIAGQNGLGTNQLKVQAFDFFAPGVTPPKSNFYDGPVFLTFLNVKASSIAPGPVVMFQPNVPAQVPMTHGTAFLQNVTIISAVPPGGFTVSADFGLINGVPAANSTVLTDPAGAGPASVIPNVRIPFIRLNLGRQRGR